ncbi:MAG: HAD family hydrolase [archaeon]
MKIKLIIFDLWQTLAYRDCKSTSSEIIKKMKLKVSQEKFIKTFEKSIQTKKWTSKYKAYENLCKNIGLKTTEKNVSALMNIRDKAEAKTKLYPHTIKILEALKKQVYKIGLISNSSVFEIKQIKNKTNLLNYVDYPLFSFNVKTIKPDLKFFKKMLKITKYKPQETIIIGDKLKDDVIPPRKIKMNSVLYKDYKTLKKNLKKFDIKI